MVPDPEIIALYNRTAVVEKARATGSCMLPSTAAPSAATMTAATQDNKKVFIG
jgi:hypothetical protein